MGDPEGDPAEKELFRTLGLTAGLQLRLGAPVPFLVEVWSDRRSGVFSRRERAQAAGLVREASRRLPAAQGGDAGRGGHFPRASENAPEIGAEDPRCAGMATA